MPPPVKITITWPDKVMLWRVIAKTPVDQPLPHAVRVELKRIAVQLYDLANNREPIPDPLDPDDPDAVLQGEVQLRKRPSKRTRGPVHKPVGLIKPEQAAKRALEVIGLSGKEIGARWEAQRGGLWRPAAGRRSQLQHQGEHRPSRTPGRSGRH